MENVIERALNGDIEEDSESQYGREEHSPVISSSSHSKFPNWFHSKSSPDDTGNVYDIDSTITTENPLLIPDVGIIKNRNVRWSSDTGINNTKIDKINDFENFYPSTYTNSNTRRNKEIDSDPSEDILHDCYSDSNSGLETYEKKYERDVQKINNKMNDSKIDKNHKNTDQLEDRSNNLNSSDLTGHIADESHNYDIYGGKIEYNRNINLQDSINYNHNDRSNNNKHENNNYNNNSNNNNNGNLYRYLHYCR